MDRSLHLAGPHEEAMRSFRTLTRTTSILGSVILTIALIATGALAVPLGHRPDAVSGCDPTFVPADAPQIQARMNACPAGTHYTFAAGTYRLVAKIIPKQGDQLFGAGSAPGGTRFTGAKVLTGWSKSGTAWVHGGAVKAGVMHDKCASGTACKYQDWLFRNGWFLSRKLAPCTKLGAKQFCTDYTAKKIYIGFNPSGYTLEYSTVVQFMVGYRFPDVTVGHFSYDKFANFGGALQGGAGWDIVDVHGHHNHACGVSLLKSTAANPATISGSTFDYNGYHGYCDPGDDPTVEGSHFNYNNRLGFDHGGGMILHGVDLGLYKGNTFSYNTGPGLAMENNAKGEGTQGVRIIGNTFAKNTGVGLRAFNACDVVIDSNTSTGNHSFAIDIANSSNNTVSNNTVVVPSSAVGGGIRVYAKNMGGSNNCGALAAARNNAVSGNDITMGTVADIGPFGNINGTVNAGGFISGESFTDDNYHMPGGNCSVQTWSWWDGATQRKVGFSGWQRSYAQDQAPSGTCGP
jgi:parallel beta-helix repeat protein